MADQITGKEKTLNSRDIIERIEELQEKRDSAQFVVGWNMAGYLPDSEPLRFETADEAAQYLAQEMRERADMIEEGADLDGPDDNGRDDSEEPRADVAEMRALRDWADALRDWADALELHDSGEWANTLQGIAYWIKENPMGDLDADEEEELEELEKLAEECEGYADWHHGETLISRDYWHAYTEDLIDDCYEMPKEMKSGNWPWRHVTLDIEAAANDLEQDYTSVEIFGNEFLIRCC